MELIKVHGDSRRDIHIVKDLLPEGKEFSFIHLKMGKAIGGCYHIVDEYYTIISGLVEIIIGNLTTGGKAGSSGMFPANTPHAFIALEDSIICEWGVPTSEKEKDIKDKDLRAKLDKINDTSI